MPSATHFQIKTYDLFDTLVARRYRSVDYIFTQLEQTFRVRGLAAARVACDSALFAKDVAYGLDDIYECLINTLKLTRSMADECRRFELDLEYQHLIPVSEEINRVQPRDIIVTETYLPPEFIIKVVREKLGIEVTSIVVTARGKTNRSIWQQFAQKYEIELHSGDNPETDIRSPASCGIATRLVTLTKYTKQEQKIADSGLPSLAKAVREIRLGTWHEKANLRQLQLAQIQCNFPMLVCGTILLAERASRIGATHILMSSRDCFLWSKLAARLFQLIPPKCEINYFFTSRIARIRASADYIEYFRSITGESNRTIIVDICGTGWSIKKLLETSGMQHSELFLLHKLSLPDLEKNYQTKFGALKSETTTTSIVSGSDYDNNLLELANPAPHSMVVDLAKLGKTYAPILVPDEHIDNAATQAIAVQCQTFVLAVDVLLKSYLREFMGEVNFGSDYLDRIKALCSDLYKNMKEYVAPLQVMGSRQMAEEPLVWETLKQLSAAKSS